jgi:phage tail sheath protein FI
MPDTFIHGVQTVEVSSGARPIQMVRSSVIGMVGTAPSADAALFPLDTPVLVTGPGDLAGLDTVGTALGTLPQAALHALQQVGTLLVVVRVDPGADAAAAQAAVIGAADATTGQYTGMQALLAAQSALGVEPKILCAPGFTGAVVLTAELITGAPVATALLSVAGKLRAVAVIDGPNTNDAAATTFAALLDNARAYVVDPWLKASFGGSVVSIAPSAAVAGAIARNDIERGWWQSPSNITLVNVVGTARPIDFRMGEATSRANVLNEARVATVINQNGWRLWGNRTPSTDARWLFLATRRIADQINQSIADSHLWAVDRGITATFAEQVVEGVRAFLRGLTAPAVGALVAADAWVDPELNTPASVQLGKLYVDYKFTPSYPAEQLIFRSLVDPDGLEELFA